MVGRWIVRLSRIHVCIPDDIVLLGRLELEFRPHRTIRNVVRTEPRSQIQCLRLARRCGMERFWSDLRVPAASAG